MCRIHPHHLVAILTEALLDQIICAAAAAHGLPSEASLSLHWFLLLLKVPEVRSGRAKRWCAFRACTKTASVLSLQQYVSPSTWAGGANEKQLGKWTVPYKHHGWIFGLPLSARVVSGRWLIDGTFEQWWVLYGWKKNQCPCLWCARD